jgi:hypothetical protein
MERRVTTNNNIGRTSYPARRIDLTYLVTSWARKIEDEHQLLWRALAALKATPILKPENCQGELRYQTLDIPLQIADMTNIQVNVVDLWSVLENQMHLGFALLATVELDTEIGFDGPLVLEAMVRVGQSEDPTEENLSALDVELKHPAKKKDANNTQEE